MKNTSYNLVMSAMFNGRKGQRPPVGNPTVKLKKSLKC